jgi:predicted O-methyltransferase YrrM
VSNIKSTIDYLANKYLIQGFLVKTPFLGEKIRAYQDLVRDSRACGYKPGHFYSPIPSRDEIRSRADTIFADTELLDVNLNLDAQFQLLETFKGMHSDLPYDFINNQENDALRYKFKNRPQYRYSDVVFLYHTMRYLKPRRIVEVGSGSSSAVMLDINDLFFSSSINLTFIEPYPDRLYRYLRESDRSTTSIIAEKVQDVPMDVFQSLEENDILFIDSSHVSKVGSDVNHIVFNILPRLAKGVWIHFHDIFYPFELPMQWVLRGRFWNESYLLRAFLMNNNAYEIMLFNSLLHKEFQDWFEKEMPECLFDAGNTGSIWLRKV